ncbi:MAG: cytochrome b [Halioglobus sp.]|nr:cytochrome b [Halioglobus sp.]
MPLNMTSCRPHAARKTRGTTPADAAGFQHIGKGYSSMASDTGSRADYTVVQKVLHWLMALIICLDLFIAQKFGNVMEDWDRLESRSDHASVGTVVTALFIMRIFFRLRHGAAALPAGMSVWQIRAAHLAHFAMYFFIGLLIFSGIATAVNAAEPITLFGQFDITLGQAGEDLFQQIRPIHEFATNAVIALIVVHILAALYHQFIARDDSTVRMLKFWRSES